MWKEAVEKSKGEGCVDDDDVQLEASDVWTEIG